MRAMLDHDADASESVLDHDMLDIDFLSSQPTSFAPRSIYQLALTDANARVLTYINTTLGNIISALSKDPWDEPRPQIVLQRVTKLSQTPEDARGGGKHSSEPRLERRQVESRQVTLGWSGKSPEEAWRFACLLAILGEIKAAIIKSVTITKRDIYYRHPGLFKKQDLVDRFIDDIAFTCGVTRKDLRVTASPKGLFCGLGLGNEVLSVPEDSSLISTPMTSDLQWILVVEKEASFKTLVEHTLHRSHQAGCGLLVTGRGYPDLNTKHFLRYVLDKAPSKTSILGLFDGDPDGLEIWRCYRTGSKRSVQESACNLPEMRWLGIDIGEFLDHPQVLEKALCLTLRDRSKAKSMLKRRGVEAIERRRESDFGVERSRRMLQFMLMLNIKLEIQAVEQLAGGFCRWLTEKMSTC